MPDSPWLSMSTETEDEKKKRLEAAKKKDDDFVPAKESTPLLGTN